jgi:hypothetical protein
MESIVKICCERILYKILDKCRITGSVLDKSKIKQLVFFLFNERLAMSRILNGRNDMFYTITLLNLVVPTCSVW